jgi:hypothetical protein
MIGEVNAILMHEVGSRSDRIIYCDRNSDTLKLRPLNLLSPLSFLTWAVLVFILILCATASTFAIFDLSSVANNSTELAF